MEYLTFLSLYCLTQFFLRIGSSSGRLCFKKLQFSFWNGWVSIVTIQQTDNTCRCMNASETNENLKSQLTCWIVFSVLPQQGCEGKESDRCFSLNGEWHQSQDFHLWGSIDLSIERTKIKMALPVWCASCYIKIPWWEQEWDTYNRMWKKVSEYFSLGNFQGCICWFCPHYTLSGSTLQVLGGISEW